MSEESKTFEENMERLEAIVKQLNTNQTSLAQSLDLFEEGLSCVKSCDNQLKSFEKKYNELVKHEEE